MAKKKYPKNKKNMAIVIAVGVAPAKKKPVKKKKTKKK